MPTEEEYEDVEVAVVVIECGDRVLTVRNPRWEAFTLPMTKVREEEDEDKETANYKGAERAAAECLGRTVTSDELKGVVDLTIPANLRGLPDFRSTLQVDKPGVSGRDRAKRYYHYKVFRVELRPPPPALAPCVVAEWLTRDQIGDPKRGPISPSVQPILERYDAIRKLEKP